jgi:hypothetical protein
MKKVIATFLLVVGFLVSVPNVDAQRVYREQRNRPVAQCWYEQDYYGRYQRVCRVFRNYGQWRREQNRNVRRYERYYDRRTRRYDYRPTFQFRINF